MITKWEDFPGVKKVHYGTFKCAVLIFEDDSFAVIDAKTGYEEGSAYPVLADETDIDALWDAMQAGAPGAEELRDAALAKLARNFEQQERQRLAYLLEKYGGES